MDNIIPAVMSAIGGMCLAMLGILNIYTSRLQRQAVDKLLDATRLLNNSSDVQRATTQFYANAMSTALQALEVITEKHIDILSVAMDEQGMQAQDTPPAGVPVLRAEQQDWAALPHLVDKRRAEVAAFDEGFKIGVSHRAPGWEDTSA